MTQANYLMLADFVLFTHVLVVAFVILGLIIILVGGALNWAWVHNTWFRLAHLGCIGIVVMQAWAGVVCPLTTLEMWLRAQADSKTYNGSFIAHWLDRILYYDLPNWVFTLAYSSFGLLVLLSWFLVRPRRLFT